MTSCPSGPSPRLPAAGFRRLLLCSFASLGLATLSARATTITPVPVNPAYDSISGTYQMQVDDGSGGSSTAVSIVHHYVTISGTNYNNVYWGQFSYAGGPARVTITLASFSGSSTFTPTLSPATAGIAVNRIAGTNQVQFTVAKGQPSFLVLSVTDSANTYPCKLIIVADPPESDLYTVPSSTNDPTHGTFNTAAAPYSATDGYSVDCAPKFNAAITDAHNYYVSTGHVGTVYVPQLTSAGSVYKISSSISPKDGVQFYIPAGVMIRADTNYANWPGYVAGKNYAAYMFDAPSFTGESPYSYLQNFTVYGRGTIDCKGIDTGGNVPFGQTALRMAVARIKDSQAIKFIGVFCREALALTFYMDRDENVSFTDVKVVNYGDHNYRENDGMDLLQCQDATANHCFIFTADDAVALKGAYSAGDTPLQAIANVVYNDMTVLTTVNGLKFGNATYTNMSDSYFANSNIVSAAYGISIEANLASTNQSISNVGYYNIRAENVTSRPVRIENTAGYTAISTVKVNDYTCDTSGASNITANTSYGGSIGSVAFGGLSIGGTIATNNTQAQLTVSGGAAQPTYVTHSNLLAGATLVASATTGTWSTSGNQTVGALTDNNAGTQASTTALNSQGQASVTYNLGATKWIDKVELFQDYGSFDVQYWKVEYYDGTWHPLFPAAVINFDTPASLAAQCFTTAGVNGWNSVGFPPVQASQIRFTFQPSSGNQVGVNEIAVLGH